MEIWRKQKPAYRVPEGWKIAIAGTKEEIEQFLQRYPDLANRRIIIGESSTLKEGLCVPLEKCYSCPYARWISVEDSTEPKLECDPPMGECPAEFDKEQ